MSEETTLRVLVTGGRGLLGSAVSRAAVRRGYDAFGPDRTDLDVTQPTQIRDRITEFRPDMLVHCAAFTAVDRAEVSSQEAFWVNEDGARNVAEAALGAGVHLVALSTDFVFDGESDRPYRTTDATAPLSVYGASKLAGEHAVLSVAPSATVVRTAGLFGAGGRDFTDAILERAEKSLPIRVVADQITQPTFVDSLADVLVELGLRQVPGVWHVSDMGPTSWYDFARAILAAVGSEAPVEPVSSAEWAAPAPRPLYSVLDVSDTERELGRALPNWRDTLSRHLGSERGR